MTLPAPAPAPAAAATAALGISEKPLGGFLNYCRRVRGPGLLFTTVRDDAQPEQ